MSTIAWDGKMLAGDKQATYCGTPVPCQKVGKGYHEGAEVLWGVTGNLEDVEAIREWFRDGRNSEKPTSLSDDADVLVIRNGKLYRYGKTMIETEILMPQWAAGSGADYALGAMAAGKSAKEAVEIAMKFDIYTGFGVDVVEVGE